MSITCLRCNVNPGPPITAISCRRLSISGMWNKVRGRNKVPSREEDILLQPVVATPAVAAPQKTSMWQGLTPEEEEKIRFKSGLPHEVLCEQRGIPVHGTRFTYLEHYRRDFVRQYFATYGRASGLKPGVCWPSKQELDFRIKWEQTFYPKLQDMLSRKRSEREQAAKELAKYRSTIMTNLKKLPAEKKAFYAKMNERKEQELAERAKREKVLQDVREYLGYDVAPGDTRFQEALAKKEEEEQAIKKASKKQQLQSAIMASLAAMAEEQVKKAAEAMEKKSPETSGQIADADSASGKPDKK